MTDREKIGIFGIKQHKIDKGLGQFMMIAVLLWVGWEGHQIYTWDDNHKPAKCAEVVYANGDVWQHCQTFKRVKEAE
jgi:hypothetical protein